MSDDRKQDWMLAPELESLWDKLDERATPRRSLNVTAIVDAAVGLAQAEGIEAVSMARVAKELGFATMAIYRHIPNKAALIVLMIDRAIGPPPAIEAATPWRDQLAQLATAQARMYQAHPWILAIPVSTPPATPNNLRWMNAMLGALRDAPLSPGEKLQALILFTTYVRGYFQLGTGDDDEDLAFFSAVERLTRAGGFEDVRAVLDALGSTTGEAGPDAEFDFGLNRLLDGLAVLFDRRSAADGDDRPAG
ncbi:MAG: TetR/AcrR family transcriptional regulator [Thermomicrobiales bacterium]